jgi:ElaB/YqjD/DUF883 family membrane-anchored ribosome-binding protein
MLLCLEGEFLKRRLKMGIKEYNQNSNASSHTADKANSLKADLRCIRDKMYETGEAIALTAHHARSNAGDQLQNSYEKICDCTSSVSESVSDYVQENPLKAIGIAAVCSLFILKLLSR